MKILHLTAKKKWYDMVLYGDKREEYREIKPYWTIRLMKRFNYTEYTHVKYTNGYGFHRPCFVIDLIKIRIGQGNPAWGAPKNKDVYIIKLGEVLATN